MGKRTITEEVVVYLRDNYKPGDAQFGMKALAARFGISTDTVKAIVHGDTYKDVGGKIHSTSERVPKDVQQALVDQYVPQSREHSIRALAKRFNLSETTVVKYLHLLNPNSRRAKVTDEIKAAIIAQYEPYSETGSRAALADKFGLSVATISNIIKEARTEPAKRGRPPTKVLDEIKEAIIIAHDEEALSVNALSERFSLSRDVIKAVLKEAGIAIRKKQVVDEDTKQEIVAAYLKGQSLRQLAEIYSINRATLAKWVEGLKPQKPKRELDDATREQIYRYHSQGYGSTIIAKTVGLSQQIVRRVIEGEL